MTGVAPSLNLRRLEYSAYEIEYEFLPAKKPPALSVDPFTPWSNESLILMRSDQSSFLDQPFLGHLSEQDTLLGSDEIFGPTESSISSNYEFNCPPWTLKRSNSTESVKLGVSNSLSQDLTATLNATCIFDTCSNQVAADLNDLPQASMSQR